MINLVLTSKNSDMLSRYTLIFEDIGGFSLTRISSGQETLDFIASHQIQLVIADEMLDEMTGLELAEKMLPISPMTNCALISSLSPKDFHESSEGLGVVSQLTSNPDPEEINLFLKHIRKIFSFTNDVKNGKK